MSPTVNCDVAVTYCSFVNGVSIIRVGLILFSSEKEIGLSKIQILNAENTKVLNVFLKVPVPL